LDRGLKEKPQSCLFNIAHPDDNQTAQDLEKAAEKVTQAIGRGRIAPAEGEKMMNVLEVHNSLFNVALHD
jgi:hypothetical protein